MSEHLDGSETEILKGKGVYVSNLEVVVDEMRLGISDIDDFGVREEEGSSFGGWPLFTVAAIILLISRGVYALAIAGICFGVGAASRKNFTVYSAVVRGNGTELVYSSRDKDAVAKFASAVKQALAVTGSPLGQDASPPKENL